MSVTDTTIPARDRFEELAAMLGYDDADAAETADRQSEEDDTLTGAAAR